MVSVNFTLLVELALFLIFLGVTNRLIFRPLLRIMDERAASIAQDKETAAAANTEAGTLEACHTEKVIEARHVATHRLRQAHDETYQANRTELDGLRHRVDQEVGVFRDQVTIQLDAERKKCAEFLPSIVTAIDERLHVEGRIL